MPKAVHLEGAEPFSVDNNLLTPTFKMRRPQVSTCAAGARGAAVALLAMRRHWSGLADASSQRALAIWQPVLRHRACSGCQRAVLQVPLTVAGACSPGWRVVSEARALQPPSCTLLPFVMCCPSCPSVPAAA